MGSECCNPCYVNEGESPHHHTTICCNNWETFTKTPCENRTETQNMYLERSDDLPRPSPVDERWCLLVSKHTYFRVFFPPLALYKSCTREERVNELIRTHSISCANCTEGSRLNSVGTF